MSKKKKERFTIENPNDWDFAITDNFTNTVYACNSNVLMKKFCILVNSIVEENEELKMEMKENEFVK